MSQNSYTDVLTELHCSMCSGFLSCSPVRVLPDGTYTCGRCSPPSDSSTYRAQALETLLEKASFPCRYAERGCTEFFMFGQTVEHELKCEYRSFACPFSICSSKKAASEMLKHFTEAHQAQILENATLKLEINEDAEGVVTILKENIAFVVKYKYDAEGTHFTYDIRFCKNDSILSASYRLQLINTSDSKNTISLKSVDCSVYDDDSFCSSQRVQKLDLNKFLQCLDCPTSVFISIHFTIHSNSSRKRKLDYEVPDYLKCDKCRNYLIPPLFHDTNVFCSDCAASDENYLPLNDEELLGTLNTTMFPCRWRNCKFVTKNNNLRKHQLECQFRQYNCTWEACKDNFTLACAANHYKEKHGCQYIEIEKQVSFETSFTEECNEGNIVTIKEHTIIDFDYEVSKKDDRKIIKLRLFSSDKPSTTDGSVYFEHQHCKVKSDSFDMISGKYLEITLDQLPTCFKEDDVLTGILTI